MIKMARDKFKGLERNFLLFLLVGVFAGIGQSVDSSTLNNFFKETFQIDILHRSVLEIPRELPGFLVFLMIGFLYALGDIRIAALAYLSAAFGMLFLGIIPHNFAIMLIFIFIYSSGQHIAMTLTNTIGMSFAGEGNLGRKLGQINAANNAALVLGSALLWVLFKFLNLSYTVAFFIGSLSFLAACILLMRMNRNQTVKIKNRFVYRKEYKLYYWLSVLYGARKQIFLTFGPWVLVDIFKQKVSTLAMLVFIISVAGIFVKPFIGYLIDKVGEKAVLCTEAILFFFVCLGYAFAEDIFSFNGALIMVSACYILDQTLGSVSMARATYLKKVALEAEDVSPTLSLGTSIDHIASMFLPALGGLVWTINGSSGYKYVFIGGAVIALINFFSARRIKIRAKVT